MNASQVRAAARRAVKRREDEIEAEEIEGGEINLVPYLDIVTNLMMFLLSLSAAGLVMGQINTTLPDHSSAAAKPAVDIDKVPQIQPVVSVTTESIILWSISGLEGTLTKPKAVIRRIGRDFPPRYEYSRLNKELYDIAKRRFGGKKRDIDSYEIVLMADGTMPYETVIDVMDNLRRRLPDDGSEAAKPVGMPATDADGKPTGTYDPDQHFLFPQIAFSSGFRK